jgi:hypothetical protein
MLMEALGYVREFAHWRGESQEQSGLAEWFFLEGWQLWIVVMVPLIAAFAKGVVNRAGVILPVLLRDVEVTPQNPLSLLRIVGRPAGVVAWCLRLVGLDRTYEIHVSERLVTVKAPGVFHEVHAIMPVSRLSVVSARYVFPLNYLLIGASAGVLLASFRDESWFFISVTLAGILCVLFRRFQIWVSAGSGYYGFSFKLGMHWRKEHVFHAVEQLRMLLVRAQEDSAVGSLSTTSIPQQPPAPQLPQLPQLPPQPAHVAPPPPSPVFANGSLPGVVSFSPPEMPPPRQGPEPAPSRATIHGFDQSTRPR